MKILEKKWDLLLVQSRDIGDDIDNTGQPVEKKNFFANAILTK